jgi:hypothetical protein
MKSFLAQFFSSLKAFHQYILLISSSFCLSFANFSCKREAPLWLWVFEVLLWCELSLDIRESVGFHFLIMHYLKLFEDL